MESNIIDGALTLVVALLGYIARGMHMKIEQTSDDLAKFQTNVASTHPTNDSIDRRFDKIDHSLDRISEKVDNNFKLIIEQINVANDK